MRNSTKGIALVTATALISGVSIFLNSYAIKGIEPTMFAGLKNLGVGLVLVAIVIGAKRIRLIKNLRRNEWLQLSVVGLIGGAIPFILYFNGLVATTAAKAGFIHKLMFIFIAFAAWKWLKEKITPAVWFGFAVLLGGQVLFLQTIPLPLTRGDALIFIAMILWAAETTISKKLLATIPPSIVAASRMFLGGVFIWIYIFISGGWQSASSLTQPQWYWVALTTALLAGYVITYYWGLRHVPAHVAASIVTIGAPITSLCALVFQQKTMSLEQIFGALIMTSALLIMIRFRPRAARQKEYVLAGHNQ